MLQSNRPRHYRKRVPYPPGRNKLSDVLTITEAAALWFKHPDTIRQHIDVGNLAARRSGKIWLISRDSLVAYYGHSPLIQRKNQRT